MFFILVQNVNDNCQLFIYQQDKIEKQSYK